MNGELIRERRKTLSLTQQQLADLVGVTQSVIGELEAETRHSVRNTTLKHLAAVLGVSADDLLTEPEPVALVAAPESAA